jgi:hypothetical protein
MAVFARVNGGAQPVQNVGVNVTTNANAQFVSTGIATPLNAYRLELDGNLAAELGYNASGTPGAVTTLLNAIAANATIIAYQIDVGTGGAGGFGAALSVLVERTGWSGNAAVQTVVRALGSNIGATQAVDASVTNVYDKGFKLARV